MSAPTITLTAFLLTSATDRTSERSSDLFPQIQVRLHSRAR